MESISRLSAASPTKSEPPRIRWVILNCHVFQNNEDNHDDDGEVLSTEEVIKPLSAPSDLDQTLFGEGAWQPLRVEEEEEELVELEECWAQ